MSLRSARKPNSMYNTADREEHTRGGDRFDLGPMIGESDADGDAIANGHRYETVECAVATTETGTGGGYGYITVTSESNHAYAVPMDAHPQEDR